MSRIDKVFSLLLVVILATPSLIIIVKPIHTSAQVTSTPYPQVTPSSSPASPSPTPSPTAIPTATPVYPKPSVPEFTVKLVSDLQENKTTIELTIKNQPFDRDNPNHYSLVYNVRIKTSTENWTDLYNPEDCYPTQSNSDYTVLTYVLGENAYYPPSDYPLSMKVGVIPTSGQVDFQVQAMIGYRDRGVFSEGIMPYVFKGEKSDWSSTQTIYISQTNSSVSPSPPVPEFSTAVALSLFVVAVLLVATTLLRKKHSSSR